MRKICYSQLCMLSEPEYVYRENGIWKFNEGDINRFYCALANAGMEWQRIMPWGVWGPHSEGLKSQFSPYVLKDGGFDLWEWNDYYFPIVKNIVYIAAKYGIKTWWVLADNCQFHGLYKKWSPWVTNVNGVTHVTSGYVDKKGDLQGSYKYFSHWISKCLLEFYGMGVGYCWSNEGNNKGFRDLAKAVIFPFLKNGAIKFNESTYGATMEAADYINGNYEGPNSTQDLLKADVGKVFGDPAKLAIWKEVHGIGEVDTWVNPSMLIQALAWWARFKDNKIRIWLSDDGVWKGDSKCDFEADTERRRPSDVRWKAVVEATSPYANDFVFEHLPKGGNLACQVQTMTAIYKAVNGKDPVPKYSYTPPSPPPTPEPPIPPSPQPPTPPQKKPWWWWWFGANSWWGKFCRFVNGIFGKD